MNEPMNINVAKFLPVTEEGFGESVTIARQVFLPDQGLKISRQRNLN